MGYSLNIYKTGGHFVPHKDTPRGDDMLGTLVVCAGPRFSGGDLALTHRGATQVFSWGLGRRGVPGGDDCHWAAFFGDVDHEVQKVWSGARVTLTWLLRRGDGAARAKGGGASHTEHFAEALSTALADEGFFPSGATLGFACFHMYAEEPGFARSVPEIDARSVLKLKGRDQHIAAAALQVGVDVRLAPYLLEEQVDQRWSLSRFPTTAERTLFRRHRLTGSDIEEKLPVETTPEGDDVCWVVTPRRSNDRARGAGQPAVVLLGEPEFSDTGYFGNEGGPCTFYMHAALLLEIPSYAKRKREHVGLPKAPKKAPTKKAPTPIAVRAVAKAPRVAPSQELTTAEVRALGYTDGKIKKLLAEGTLERTGFGWYRFLRVP